MLFALLMLGPSAWGQTTPASPAPIEEATPDDDPNSEASRLAQAKELYRLGAGLYNAGRYREAIATFREALALSDRKALLYNIANAQERLNDLEGALASLREYRPHADPKDRVSLDPRITSLEDRLFAQSGQTPAGAGPRPAAGQGRTAQSGQVPANVATVEPAVRRRPRWALVGTGAVLAAGFTTAAVWSFNQGQSHREAGDEAAYGTSRTVNNISVPLAGLGGGLAVLGFVIPGKRTVAISAHPRGARLDLRF